MKDKSISESKNGVAKNPTKKKVVSNRGSSLVKETWRSWMVLVACFFGQAISVGNFYSFGVLFVAIIDELKASPTQAAWVGSCSISFCFVVGLITGYLCERLGCRLVMICGGALAGTGFVLSSFVDCTQQLFITYGIVTSLGLSCLFFSSLLSLPLYFERHLTLANAIASGGSGVGGLFLSPFMEHVNRNYGLRRTFQICSLMYIIPICAGLLIDRKSKNRKMLPFIKTIIDRNILGNKAFLVYTASMSVCLFAYYIPYVHLVRFMESKGVSSQEAALVVGVSTISSVSGKIVLGKVAEVHWVNRIYVAQIALTLLSVSLCFLTLANSYTHFMIFAVVYGALDGGFCSYIIVVCMEVCKRGQISVAFGFMYSVSSLFSLAGPPFAGFLQAVSNYEVTFNVCGSFFIIGALLLFTIPYLLPEDVIEEKRLQMCLVVPGSEIEVLESNQDPGSDENLNLIKKEGRCMGFIYNGSALEYQVINVNESGADSEDIHHVTTNGTDVESGMKESETKLPEIRIFGPTPKQSCNDIASNLFTGDREKNHLKSSKSDEPMPFQSNSNSKMTSASDCSVSVDTNILSKSNTDIVTKCTNYLSNGSKARMSASTSFLSQQAGPSHLSRLSKRQHNTGSRQWVSVISMTDVINGFYEPATASGDSVRGETMKRYEM